MDANEQLAALLESKPYEPSTASILENHVANQLTSKTYNFAVLKALLKYYQLYYDPSKLDFVCNVLILGLMRLASTDFLSLTYLIPTSINTDEKIVLIKNCASLLESGKFLEFWEEYISAPEALFSQALGFVEAIRVFILATLSVTFKNISKDAFMQHLGLNDSSIVAFCASNDYIEKIDGDNVVFVANEENQKKEKKNFDDNYRVDEGLRLVEFLRTSGE